MAASLMDTHYPLGSSSGSSSHPTSILPLDRSHHSSSLEQRGRVVADASPREGKRRATEVHDFLSEDEDGDNEIPVEEDRRSYTSSDDAEGSEDEEWLAYQQSLTSSQQTTATTEEQQEPILAPPLSIRTLTSSFSQPGSASTSLSQPNPLDRSQGPSISSSAESQKAREPGDTGKRPDDDDGVFSEEILSSSEKSEDESESELTEQETSDDEDEEDPEEEPEEDLGEEESDGEDDTPLALQISKDSADSAQEQALLMTPSVPHALREAEDIVPESRQGPIGEVVPSTHQGRCTEDQGNDSDLEVEGGPAEDVAEYDDDAQEEAQSAEDEDEDMEDQEVGPDGVSSIAVEAHLLNEAIPTLKDKYKIVGKLGEGTFSTVYKARPLRRRPVDRSSRLANPYAKALGSQWYIQSHRHRLDLTAESPYRRGLGEGNAYVALKRIYVSSSPQRIVNELNILVELRNRNNISHLIDIFREREQIIAVMEYTEHADFRDFYRILPIGDIRCYFRCLFAALADVHQANVIHRDVKPANFLYNPTTGHGVLCDFGLAERFNPSEWRGKCHHTCPDERNIHGKNVINTAVTSTVLPDIKKIQRQTDTKDSTAAADSSSSTSTPRIGSSTGPHVPMPPPADEPEEAQWLKQSERVGYPTVDNRHPVRANRAGTRGFRAPEVLLKCQDQTVAVDIWSAGVILLCFLTKRFPLFNADDDVVALLEMAVIVGRKDMAACAMIHNRTFKTDVPDVTEGGMSIKDFVRRMNPLPQEELENELSNVDGAIRLRKEGKTVQTGGKRPLAETTVPTQSLAVDLDDVELARLERRKMQISSKLQAWDDAIALATRCLNVFHTKRWSAARILEKDPFFNKRATAGEDLFEDADASNAFDDTVEEPSAKKARRMLI